MSGFNKAELAKLEQRLKEVTEKVAKKALRRSGRKAMKKVRDEARQNAPEDTGLLESNFALTTNFKGSTLYVKVGVKGGARKNPITPYYFRMVELGTKDMPANPFMRPALEGNADEILATLTDELIRALDQE